MLIPHNYATMLLGCLLVSLFIRGLYKACQPGYILCAPTDRLSAILYRTIGRRAYYIITPLWGCPVCMSSAWTVLAWIATPLFDAYTVMPAVLVTAGLNSLINKD